ncbi:hypothetical protein AVEN_157437-1 [Araneus ventricosus]|uniref:Uncharacterized protein n=1 Tax=Araneus ventricosus TaxID=182803 RepID=A0A4Y2V621_ARAVE|nr:hypothetical protein AVEN_157437-1 [Araneus ventricosus]
MTNIKLGLICNRQLLGAPPCSTFRLKDTRWTPNLNRLLLGTAIFITHHETQDAEISEDVDGNTFLILHLHCTKPSHPSPRAEPVTGKNPHPKDLLWL